MIAREPGGTAVIVRGNDGTAQGPSPTTRCDFSNPRSVDSRIAVDAGVEWG